MEKIHNLDNILGIIIFCRDKKTLIVDFENFK